jgi:hypothetical protein
MKIQPIEPRYLPTRDGDFEAMGYDCGGKLLTLVSVLMVTKNRPGAGAFTATTAHHGNGEHVDAREEL